MKVMAGGAPVNGKYVREIGADGYAHDAGGGSKPAEGFLQER
jgi:methanogenic corrinoid protein MtbC1